MKKRVLDYWAQEKP